MFSMHGLLLSQQGVSLRQQLPSLLTQLILFHGGISGLRHEAVALCNGLVTLPDQPVLLRLEARPLTRPQFLVFG